MLAVAAWRWWRNLGKLEDQLETWISLELKVSWVGHDLAQGMQREMITL